MKIKALHQLNDYPKMIGSLRVRARDVAPGYCGCISPIPQRLGLWEAWQCLKCGKKIGDA